jgi:hypothetical protein
MSTHTPTPILDQTGPVTHEEAKGIATRYNRSHWYPKGEGERARYTIPADPRRDDDIRLEAYIAQQQARDDAHAALQQRVAGLEEALGDMLGTLDAHTVVTENCDGTDDKYCDCVDRITRKAKAALTGSATVTAFGAMREALRRLTLSAHKLVVEVCGDSCNCARRGTCEKCMVRNDVRAGHDALALADGGAGGGGEGSGT